jgi:hypothetical protein
MVVIAASLNYQLERFVAGTPGLPAAVAVEHLPPLATKLGGGF